MISRRKVFNYLKDEKNKDIFYDRFKNNFIVFDEKEIAKLEKYNFEDLGPVEKDKLLTYDECYDDDATYVHLPALKNTYLVKQYAKKIKNKELLELCKTRKSFSYLLIYIKEHDLEKSWNRFYRNAINQIIDDWLIMNELDSFVPSKDEARTLYELTNEVLELQPWKYFSDLDDFVIEVPGGMIITYTILGQANKQYGVCMYFGEEEFNNHILERNMVCSNSESAIAGFIKDSYNLYYDELEDLDDFDLDLLKKADVKINNDRYYPNYLVMKKGLMPTSIMNKFTYDTFVFGLILLIKFLFVYTKKTHKHDSEFHYKVQYNFNEMTYKKMKFPFLPSPEYLQIINSETIERFRSEAETFDGAYYCGVDILPAPVNYGDYNAITFLIIILDEDKNIIYSEPVNNPNGEYMKEIAYAISGFFINNGVPKKLYASNQIMLYILLSLMGDMAKVKMIDDDKIFNRIYHDLYEQFKQLHEENNIVA